MHQPALLEPLSVALLGVLHRLHDAHQRDVGAGRRRRAATLTHQTSLPRKTGSVGGAWWCARGRPDRETEFTYAMYAKHTFVRKLFALRLYVYVFVYVFRRRIGVG